MQNHIKFLFNYCQDKPELYNKVASILWVQFGLRSAELDLLCTFITSEIIKDRRFINEYTTRNNESDIRLGENPEGKGNHSGGNVKNDRSKSVKYC